MGGRLSAGIAASALLAAASLAVFGAPDPGRAFAPLTDLSGAPPSLFTVAALLAWMGVAVLVLVTIVDARRAARRRPPRAGSSWVRAWIVLVVGTVALATAIGHVVTTDRVCCGGAASVREVTGVAP